MKKLRSFLACGDQRLKVAALLLLDEAGMAIVASPTAMPELLLQVENTRSDLLALEWDLSDLSLINLLIELHNPNEEIKRMVM